MGDFSAADVLAMTRNEGSGSFLEGNGIIILILFFLMLGGGFGGGWGNAAGSAAMQGTMTRAEMQDGFNNQNTVNTLNNLSIGLNNGFNQISMGMCNGFNSVNQNINNLGFAMQNSCCEIKTALHTEGELTRGLITQNEINSLNAKLADKDRELNSAIFAASQLTQTKTLEDFILANKA